MPACIWPLMALWLLSGARIVQVPLEARKLILSQLAWTYHGRDILPMPDQVVGSPFFLRGMMGHTWVLQIVVFNCPSSIRADGSCFFFHVSVKLAQPCLHSAHWVDSLHCIWISCVQPNYSFSSLCWSMSKSKEISKYSNKTIHNQVACRRSHIGHVPLENKWIQKLSKSWQLKIVLFYHIKQKVSNLCSPI